MKGYNFYTVTLNNTRTESGITGGRIDYSPVFCGDCLVPLNECGHESESKQTRGRK